MKIVFLTLITSILMFTNLRAESPINEFNNLDETQSNILTSRSFEQLKQITRLTYKDSDKGQINLRQSTPSTKKLLHSINNNDFFFCVKKETKNYTSSFSYLASKECMFEKEIPSDSINNVDSAGCMPEAEVYNLIHLIQEELKKQTDLQAYLKLTGWLECLYYIKQKYLLKR